MNMMHRSRLRHLAALLIALLAAPASSSTPASASACAATYIVHPGDSLWSISQMCGVPLATLQRLNRLGQFLQPGQVLQLVDPMSEQTYVVQPGDTLSAIAQRAGVTPATLAALNGLTDPNNLQVGQVLHWQTSDVATAASPAVPAGAGTAAGTASGLYRVQPGDTLTSIALAHNITLGALESANGLADPNLLAVGSLLHLPIGGGAQTSSASDQATTATTMGTYRVQPGDTLSGIAQAFGLTVDGLVQTNHLDPSRPIQPGQILHYAIVVYTGPSLSEVGAVLDQMSAQLGVENALLKAIAWRESNWRMLDSADGGIGVMQLMPDTVQWLQQTYLPGSWDPHNLSDNVRAGAVVLQVYSRLYGGDVAKIATAYHGGMGAVGLPPTAEMTRYVKAVIAFRQAFLAGTFPS
jgi:LysM repeat protein